MIPDIFRLFSIFFQFYGLEDNIQGENNEKRSRLRHALLSMCPRKSKNPGGVETYPIPISVARSACRTIAGDHLFQFFTREQATRAKTFPGKMSIQDRLPALSRVITAVIIHNANTDMDTALSAFGRHLAKCPDRAKSRTFLAAYLSSTSPDEPPAKSATVSSSDSDSDTD